MPKCFICGSEKIINGVRGFYFCGEHQKQADKMFEKFEGGNMDLETLKKLENMEKDIRHLRDTLRDGSEEWKASNEVLKSLNHLSSLLQKK